MDELIKLDNTFSEAMFKSKSSHIYIMLQYAIADLNLDTVSHYISKEVYDYYNEKIDYLKRNNKKKVIEKLTINSNKIINIEITKEKYIIKTLLVLQYIGFLIDETTNKLIPHSYENNENMERILTFVKQKNSNDIISLKCKSCGANMNLNYSGKCDYCGTIVETITNDWILMDIE